MPLFQSVDDHCQQLDVVPVVELVNAVAKKRDDLHEVAAKCIETAPLDFLEPALGNHECALPVIPATDQHENLPAVEMAQSVARIRGMSGKPHPQNVDRRRES